jgi:hypothetical protein
VKPSVAATIRPNADAYAGLANLNIIGVLDRGLPFVQKPFTGAVLARTVREAFSHPGARPAALID